MGSSLYPPSFRGVVEALADLGTASRTPSSSAVASSASSVTIASEDTDRVALWVSNDSAEKLYLSYTSPATASNGFVAIPAGGFFSVDTGRPTQAVYGIWASADGNALVTTFT